MIAECLSSANNLMRLAAEEHPELTVKVFDSKSASIGLGALAVQVARYAVRGVAFDPLCELTKRLIDDTVVYFSLDTLEYLQRGGRIGRATALAGGLLQIKPILTFDRKDGMISTAAKVRGRRGVQQRLIELATELAAKHPGEEYNLVVCDGNVPEEGAALEAALTRALPNAHRVLHGKIDATVLAVSEDAFLKKTAAGEQSVYRARLELPPDPLSSMRNLPQGFTILPGMTVSAEINVGERRIIEYFLYPIIAGFDQSLREPR